MVKIYSTSWCPSCISAKKLLDAENIKYQEINIEDENISRQDLLEFSGGYTVPKIFINDQCIGGYDDLIKLHQENQLMELINE